MWLVQSEGGYHKRDLGHEVSSEANHVHVPDVYDALTGKGRAYRDPAQSRIAQKLIMRGERKEFDPRLVRKYVELMGFDYSDLRNEIETDKFVLLLLLRGAGTIYNKEAVEALIKKNEYNLFELKKKIEEEDRLAANPVYATAV